MSEPFQYGAPGIGTFNHLAAEMFARAAKIKLMAIPYKGSNPLTTDLIGGHIKIGFNPIPVSRGAIEGGIIRALAVTTAKRSSLLPDVATLAEQGLPGFDVSLRYGLSAPAGTPPAIVARLNKALNAALADEAVIKRIRHEGAEPTPITPQAIRRRHRRRGDPLVGGGQGPRHGRELRTHVRSCRRANRSNEKRSSLD